MKFRHYLKTKLKFILGLSILAAVLSTVVFPGGQILASEPMFNIKPGVGAEDGDYELFRGRNESANETDWIDPVSGQAGNIFSGVIYYHNGVEDTIAQNTRIKVQIPERTINKSARLDAYISADNAPEISDTIINGVRRGLPGLTVNLNSDAALEYVPGSVRWYPDTLIIGENASQPLPFGQTGDEIVTPQGINIGNIQGCWQFAGFITFKFKTTPIAEPSIGLQKTVRNITEQQASFTKVTDALASQVVEFNVDLTNNGNVPLANILVTDSLPQEFQFVPGSLKQIIGSSTISLSDGIAQQLFSSAGWPKPETLSPAETQTLRFQATVINTTKQTLENIATAIVGLMRVSDSATVNLRPFKIALSKKAFNRSTNIPSALEPVGGVDAETLTANIGEEVVYTLATKNVDTVPVNITIEDDISDILSQADVLEVSDQGSVSNNFIRYPQVVINPGQILDRTFAIKIKDATGNGPGVIAIDDKLINIYGNKVIVYIERPVQRAEVKIQKLVRDFTSNEPNFVKANEANAGDTLEYRIDYTNAGNTPADQVKVTDVLPPNTQYLLGTTVIAKNGGQEKTVIDGITGPGILIDTILPGESSYLKFRIMTSPKIAGGEVLVNAVTLKFGEITISDFAKTTIKAPVVPAAPVVPQQPSAPRVPPITLPPSGAAASASFILTFMLGVVFVYLRYRQVFGRSLEVLKISSDIYNF